MSRSPRHRRPLIEALEPRLLFSATADIAVFDDGNSDVAHLAQAAQEVDLVSIYMSDEPSIMESQSFDADPQADIPFSETSAVKTVVFVDTAVAGYDALVNDIRSRFDSDSVAIIYLDPTTNGVEQITNALGQYAGLNSIHIISHGSAGAVELGNAILTDNSLVQYEDDLIAWGGALDADADILFYGCDVAINPAGQALIEKIARLTDADVAASSDVTGHDSLGGDWDLEYKVGDIESGVLISTEAQQSFVGVMATTHFVNIQGGSSSQPFSGASNIGQTFQYDSSGPTYTINQISVQLKKDPTAANQTITLELRQGGYNGTWLASATINANTIGTDFEWKTFGLGNIALNDNQAYCIRLISTSADGKVSAAYSASNIWNNAELIVNGVANSSADMSLLVSYFDGSNSVPTVANPIPNQSTNEEAWYSYTFPSNTFADADFPTTLTYTATLSDGSPLPPWLSFNATTRTFSGFPDDGDVGTLSIRVTASDGVGGTVNDNFDLAINNINDLPFVNIPIPNQNATEDSAFNYSFPANTFGDGDVGVVFTYTAELASGGSLPSWLHFDSATRTFSGTPLNGDVGTISIKVIANDGGGATVSDNFDIVIANTNDAPSVANQIPNQTATENVLFNYTFPINTFNDQDVGDTLTYTAQLPGGTPLPAWLSFDSATRTLSGIPSNGDVGNITVEVIASDGTTTVSDFFDITVQNVGSSNSNYESSGPASNSQSLSSGVPLYQSFMHDSVGATYTIDSIILQLAKDPAASAQTITVSLISGTYNGTVISSDTISSASLNTVLSWHAFSFSGTPLNDGQIYFIKVETSSFDGLVKAGIHNTDVYPNGSYHSSSGTPDVTRDLAFQVSSGVNNDPTIANPIPNQNATEDAAFNFQFNSNTFSDIDVGDTLTYSATMADGSNLPGWLSFNAATRTFFGTPVNADVGTISIKVTADDGQGGTPATDTFDLVIANTNDAPTVANPIPNQNATEDSAFNFTFASNTFTDQDVGNTLTYTAQLAGGGALPSWITFDPTTRTFSGTPLNAHVGTLSIDVIANDGNGGAVTDTFNIVIDNTNDAPIVANTIPNQNAAEDTLFIFQFAGNTFSDPDVGDTLAYSAQLSGGGALPSWLLFNPGNRTFSGMPSQSDVGTIAIDVIASDGNGGTVIDTFNIVIAPTNDAPTVTISTSDYYAIEQVPIDLHNTGISVADADDDPLTITITGAGTNSNLTAGVGTTGVIVVSGTNTNTLILTGTAGQLNDLFAGNNGGTLTYRLSGDTPAATRLLTISASDGGLSGSDTAIIHITAVNDAPENTVPGAQIISEDTALIFSAGNSNQIQISDLDAGSSNLEVTLSVTNGTLTLAGVVGLSFTTGDGTGDSTLVFTGTLANINTALATLTFNPTLNYNGAAVLSIATSDLGNTGSGGTLTDTDTVNITVNASNDAPTVANPIPNQNATEDSAFNFQFASNTFIDVDGDSLTYSAQLNGGGTLPSWLTFNAASRTFSGTPANGDVGTLSIDVIANDGNGGTITDTFNIVIANTNDAPTVANPIPDRVANENTVFNFQFAANTFNDIDVGDTLTYLAQLAGGGSLPSWLSFDAVTRTLTGVPSATDTGVLNIDVIASDGNGGLVTDTFTITVAGAPDTEYIDTGNGGNFNPVSSANQLGQSFSYDSAGATYTVNEISLSLARYDAAALQTITVELRDSWNGAIIASASISSSQISRDGFNWHSFSFGDVMLNDQQTYVIQISSTGTDDLVLVSRFSGNVFADGSLIENGIPHASGWDLAFKVSKDDGANSALVADNPITNQSIDAELPFNFVMPANTFSDPDVNDTLMYRAQLAGGGSLDWLMFNEASRTFSGTPHWYQAGTMTVELIATDNHGASTSTFFDIEVINTNTAPTVANPIPDVVTNEDAAFNFQFAANTFGDVDGNSFTYTAELAVIGGLPPWLTFDSATRTFSGTPANGDVGTWTVEVTANDGFGGTVVDTFVITVANTNDAPTILNTLPDRTATQGTAFNFQFVANTFIDQDVGDVLTYTAQLSGGGTLPTWLSFDSATRTFSGTPGNSDVGTISVEVIADDGNGGTVSDTFDLVVNNINDAPTVTNPIPDQNATEDNAFNFQFAANAFDDVDVGSSLTYSAQLNGGAALPTWLIFDPVTRTFSGTPVNADVGTINIDVIANDGLGGTVTDTFAIVIANTNDAPTLANPIPDQSATESLAFNFTFSTNTFNDEDVGDVFIYSAQLAGGGALPSWLIFDAVTRTFSGTPTSANLGSISIEVIASDGNGGTITDTFDLVVSALPVNAAPILQNAIADQSTNEDSLFRFTIPANTFADADGDALGYSARMADGSAMPSWLSFDAATRTFSGTPANDDVGNLEIIVSVSDGNGGSASDAFVIAVNNTNDAPVLAIPPTNQTAEEDVPFTVTFPANMFTDVDAGTRLSYTAQLANGHPLPAWLVFDAATLTFSGTPIEGDVGILSIQLIASDGIENASAQFQLNILAVNDAPVTSGLAPIVNVEDAVGDTVDLFSAFIDDIDASNQLQYSVVSNTNPALVSGAVIDPVTGKLQLTYGANQFGNAELIIRAQDSEGALVETVLKITITPVNDTPRSTGITDVKVQAGAAAQQTNLHSVFSDIEDGTALRYSVVGNTNSAVATNILIDPVSGVMTVAFASVSGGESVVTLRAMDADGAWVETHFKVTVTARDTGVIPEEQGKNPPTLPPVTPPVVPPTTPPAEIPGGENPTTPPVGGGGPLLPVQPGDTLDPGLPGTGNPVAPDADDIDDPRKEFGFVDDKSSRDYERANELLNSGNIPLSTLNASPALMSLIALDAGFAPWEAEQFDSEVRRIRAQMDEAMEEESDRKAVVAGITFSVTTGLLIWSLRASSLLLTMMSMLPLWRGLDPLPILEEVNKKKKELEQQRKDRESEDKSAKEVGYLFDHAQGKDSKS